MDFPYVMSALSRKLFGRCSLFSVKNKVNLRRLKTSAVSYNVPSSSDDKQSGIWSNPNVIKWMTAYEDLVGLTEVKNVQTKVVEAEREFQTVQQDRRRHQQSMLEIQAKLKEIHTQLEKVQRGDEKYLTLLTQEHQIIRDERTLATDLAYLEDKEHATFAALSSAVRESHEKERSRAERTKYWSVSASVIGVVLGILGTSINNYVRMRQLRGLIQEQAEDSGQLKALLNSLSETVATEHNQVKVFISDLTQLLHGQGSAKQLADVPPSSREEDTRHMLQVILQQDRELQADMGHIKDTLAKVKVTGASEVTYCEGDMESLLDRTESQLEYRMKVNALWTVTAVYGALAITIPVLYNLFSGGTGS